jgi:hypothetical protein
MSVGFGYIFNQTFKNADLARCMFGSNVLTFQGSQVAGRSSTALLADQFGLSPLFNGTLKVCPEVRNHSLKFEAYWGFDNWLEGLYLRTDLTFTHQQRRLFEDCSACLTSTVITTTPFPPGYMAAGSVTPAPDILTALSGTFLFGDMQTPWSFGRWDTSKHSDDKIAGFSVDLGYNFWTGFDSHLGVFLRYEAPTGTNINGRQRGASSVFFPVIGNMHHHGFGGGITAHKELWVSDCGGSSLEICLDGYATHLFSNCQVRSFNLVSTSTLTVPGFPTCPLECDDNNSNNCGTTTNSLGCLSRYMLLKQLTPTTATGANGSALGYAFTGTLIPAINYSTRNVKSSIGVTGDATVALLYKNNGFTVELGYNIFGRQREKLCLRTGTVPCDNYNPNFSYGLKGCTGDYYYAYAESDAGTSGAGTPTLLNATATSSANIFGCGTTDNPVPVLGGGIVGVDWSNAFVGNGAPANAIIAGTAVDTLTIASTSDPAVILTDANIDIESGRVARLLSNKGFLAMYYEWEECGWLTFLGVGGEAEGGNHCCDIKQWGVWVKGGFSF